MLLLMSVNEFVCDSELICVIADIAGLGEGLAAYAVRTCSMRIGCGELRSMNFGLGSRACLLMTMASFKTL